MSTFNVGDRVRYIGKGSIRTTEFLGLLGTITEVQNTTTGIWVRFDDRDIATSVLRENIEKVAEPDQKSIEIALDVLRAAGEVSFVPFRKPFARSLPLNNEYHAKITDKGITVGCQKFDLGTAVELGRLAQEALDYNAGETK